MPRREYDTVRDSMRDRASRTGEILSNNQGKVLIGLVVSAIFGGGAGLNQISDIPTKNEIELMVENVANKAADRAVEKAMTRVSGVEERLGRRIDRLKDDVDRITPYAAAAAPLIQKDQEARREYREVEEGVKQRREPQLKRIYRGEPE